MAGGICTRDFSAQTLESHRVKGLFAAGEVLDVTGDSAALTSSGLVFGLCGWDAQRADVTCYAFLKLNSP